MTNDVELKQIQADVDRVQTEKAAALAELNLYAQKHQKQQDEIKRLQGELAKLRSELRKLLAENQSFRDQNEALMRERRGR